METTDRSSYQLIRRRAFIEGVVAALGALLVGARSDLSPWGAASAEAAGTTGNIFTIAGGGAIGDGGAATSAAMSTPFSTSFDAAGNLYIADTYFHRIYQVAAGSGIFTTVAGSGMPGYGGDGGAATSAQLLEPDAVVPDQHGNLYIADTNNNRIRRVNHATGVINTVVGTGVGGYNGDALPAFLAQVNSPRGVLFDSRGNLYIADTGNARVRVVNLGTQPLVVYPLCANPLIVQPGQIATIAGDGITGGKGDGGPATAAQLALPHGIAFDAQGRLYIADLLNQRIRKVDGATGIITTVAGTGSVGSGGDGGPAVQAALNYPTGVAIDSKGNLYIGQQQNARIRKVDAQTQIISTYAGQGTTASGFAGDGGPATSAWLNGPTGVTLDAADNLYIADYNNARVRRVDATTQVITTVAGSAQVGDGGPAGASVLNEVCSMAFDRAGRLLITDQGNQRIRVVGTASAIATLAGTGLSGFNGDGIVAWGSRLNLPSDAQMDPAGNLYITDESNYRVRRVDAHSGVMSTVVGIGLPGYGGDGGPAVMALLSIPRALLVDAAGNLYIADMNNQRVRFVNTTAQPVTLYAGSAQSLVVPPSQIVTLAGTGVAGSTGDGGPAVSATLNQPRGLALDAHNNLYVTECGQDSQTPHLPPTPPDSRLRRIDGQSGIITTIAGIGWPGYNGDHIPATLARLNGPRGVVVSPAGHIFIADCYNHRIRRIDAHTQIITTVVGTGVPGLSGDGGPATAAMVCLPRYVAIDASGNLWVTDSGNSRIRYVVGGAQ